MFTSRVVETSMESFILLLLLLLPLSFFLIFFIRKKGSGDLKNLPPGSTGWPILGESMELSKIGYQKFVRDRKQKYSPEVFKTSLLGEKTAVFCSAQGNKFLFSNENKLVTSWLPQSLKTALLPEFSKGNYMEAVIIFHKLKYEALKPDALKRYVQAMDSLAREQLDKEWRPNETVKVFPWSKKYSLALACRVFMNVVNTEQRAAKLVDLFTLLREGLLSMPINFPGTAFSRAVQAGKVARAELLRIVEERREAVMDAENKESEGRDVLSKVLLLKGEDGKHLSDGKVSDFLVSLLMASLDPTASAITSVMNFLAQLPHIYDEVFKEQMLIAKSKGPGEMLTWEDVEKMKYSWNVVRETLRLAPPAQGAFRVATTEFTYAGFTIPKGWKAFWTVHSSHMNPDYFPEPEKFDPSRFEGSGPAPYTFIPFGGGPSICSGRDFAKLAILVFMHNVVTRFRLEKAIPNEEMLFHSSLKPAHGLPLHLHPHSK